MKSRWRMRQLLYDFLSHPLTMGVFVWVLWLAVICCTRAWGQVWQPDRGPAVFGDFGPAALTAMVPPQDSSVTTTTYGKPTLPPDLTTTTKPTLPPTTTTKPSSTTTTT